MRDVQIVCLRLGWPCRRIARGMESAVRAGAIRERPTKLTAGRGATHGRARGNYPDACAIGTSHGRACSRWPYNDVRINSPLRAGCANEMRLATLVRSTADRVTSVNVARPTSERPRTPGMNGVSGSIFSLRRLAKEKRGTKRRKAGGDQHWPTTTVNPSLVPIFGRSTSTTTKRIVT